MRNIKSLKIDILHIFQVSLWMYFLCKKDSLICKHKEKRNKVTGADHAIHSDCSGECMANQRLLYQACIASRQ